MKEQTLMGKIFGMTLVLVIILGGLGGSLISVSQAEASPATVYVPDDYPTIQAAVNASNPGDTIIVRAGTYTENIDVNKDHLTIQSESGAEVTIVQAADPDDHVFDVTTDYVTMSGFTATNATGRSPYDTPAAGIHLSSVNHCSIFNNDASTNNFGIRLYYSSNNTIENNVVSENEQGIEVGYHSSSNTLLNNRVSDNTIKGISLYYSSNNTLRGNIMSNNGNNFGVWTWTELSDFRHDIDTSNTVDGKPIYYLVDEKDKVIDSSTNAGCVVVVNSTNIVVRDLTLMNNFLSVHFAYTNDSRIENVTTSDNSGGIWLQYSNNNTLVSNNVSNSFHGICLWDSGDNILRLNTMSDNSLNFGFWSGSKPSHFRQDIDTSNTVDGKPIYYMVGEQDVVIDSSSNAGYIGAVNSANISIRDLTLTNNEQGVLLAWTENSRIENVTVSKTSGGIWLQNSTNNTLIGCDSSNSLEGYGVYLGWSNDNILENDNFSQNSGEGIRLLYSSNNTITNNDCSNNGVDGIWLYASSNNSIQSNTANSNGGCGIYLRGSGNNTLGNNTMSGNTYNFFCFYGEQLSHFIQDIDASNRVDGKPIYYWVDQHDSEIPNDAGFVALINCTNIAVKDLTLTHNVAGVLLVSSTDSRIENVTASNNYGGIGLLDSSNNIVTGSTCNNNDEVGIYIYQSNNNSITNNIIESSKGMDVINSSYNVISQNSACSNAGDGIWLWNSSYNTISNNEACDNTVHSGISLGASHNNTLIDNVANANQHNGINLYAGSTDNELIHNTLQENNAHGIAIDSSSGNVIVRNTISSNNCGIGIYRSSSNNIIYVNSFSNACNVCSDEQPTNMWDSPEEITYSYGGNMHTNYLGNYWNDYTGNDADGDGIGDTPYPLDSDADNYPLVEPSENYTIAHYDLAIDSTAGGEVTAPGEGTFTYFVGTVVNLVASADGGYRFVSWTGDIATIADLDAASTTITMNGNYSVTANFEKQPSGGLCFIATAVYGTPMAEEVGILREFRDDYLLTNPLGQAFVDFYYRVSPPIADFITDHPNLKPMVKAGLVPAVAMSTIAVNTSPAQKAAIVGVLALVSVALTVWATRQRGRDPEYT